VQIVIRRAAVALLLVAVALIPASPASASNALIVHVDGGLLRGASSAGVHSFLGVPYAAPPVADLRWRPPQPAARWHGPRDATKFADHCPQTASPFGFASTTEDCLYLNVFTPNRGGKGHAKGLPVMVWLHGGGLTVGDSDDYNPDRLVERGVIVVTVNYRLGYLGFLAHPALSAESGGKGSGNYGLMDQQAALRWVQRNITKFGGDTDNVTIFGQSAGGLSVHSQLASPAASGLFDRAIAQSGAYSTTFPSQSAAEQSGESAAQNFGCADQTLACMRAASISTILAVQPQVAGAIVPNVDSNILPRSPSTAFASGQFNRVPVIEGSTHDEFTIFTKLFVEPLLGGPVPDAFYPIVVPLFASTLGLNATGPEILAEYPLSNYLNAGAAISAIGTDATFACSGRRTARVLSQYVPTRTYDLDDPDVPMIFDVPPSNFPFGSYHAADLAFLFDSELRGGHAPLSADEESLASAMVGYWTQFADTGSPNGPGLPQWPAYTAANDTYMRFHPPTPQPTTGFAADHHCAFWDAHS
jgi:para-nitrobenzyl esterase